MPVVVLAVRSDSLQRASAVNPAVARDVEMVTDILETAVVDMVVAAGLEIQVPPLGGGGTMDDGSMLSCAYRPVKYNFVYL